MKQFITAIALIPVMIVGLIPIGLTACSDSVPDTSATPEPSRKNPIKIEGNVVYLSDGADYTDNEGGHIIRAKGKRITVRAKNSELHLMDAETVVHLPDADSGLDIYYPPGATIQYGGPSPFTAPGSVDSAR